MRQIEHNGDTLTVPDGVNLTIDITVNEYGSIYQELREVWPDGGMPRDDIEAITEQMLRDIEDETGFDISDYVDVVV